MIKTILTFVSIWGALFFGFSYFWYITRTEKFNIVKMTVYSFLTAIVALIMLVGIVILF